MNEFESGDTIHIANKPDLVGRILSIENSEARIKFNDGGIYKCNLSSLCYIPTEEEIIKRRDNLKNKWSKQELKRKDTSRIEVEFNPVKILG